MMTMIVRAAAFLMASLALFHLWGAVVLAYHLLAGRSTVLFVFGISRSSHERFHEWGQSAFALMAWLLILAFIMRCLVEGLWKEKRWAWASSLVLCGLLIFERITTMEGWMPHVQVIKWNFIAYCCFIMLALLFSTPAFFKRQVPPK